MEIVNFNLHGPQEKSESLMGSETSTQTIENLNLDQGLVDVKSDDESHHTLKPLATEKDTVSPGLAYIPNIKLGGVKHHPDNEHERSHNGYEALDASYMYKKGINDLPDEVLTKILSHLPWDAPWERDISRVCHKWRDIVCNTPYFWSSMSMELNTLNLLLDMNTHGCQLLRISEVNNWSTDGKYKKDRTVSGSEGQAGPFKKNVMIKIPRTSYCFPLFWFLPLRLFSIRSLEIDMEDPISSLCPNSGALYDFLCDYVRLEELALRFGSEDRSEEGLDFFEVQEEENGIPLQPTLISLDRLQIFKVKCLDKHIAQIITSAFYKTFHTPSLWELDIGGVEGSHIGHRLGRNLLNILKMRPLRNLRYLSGTAFWISQCYPVFNFNELRSLRLYGFNRSGLESLRKWLEDGESGLLPNLSKLDMDISVRERDTNLINDLKEIIGRRQSPQTGEVKRIELTLGRF